MDQSKSEELMNILGLSRRVQEYFLSGRIILGGGKHNEKLVVVVTSDCSANVLFLKPRVERGEAILLKLEDTDRTTLGSYLAGISPDRCASAWRTG